jgi:hypothetical protein
MSVDIKEGVYWRQANPILIVALVICFGGAVCAYWFNASTTTLFLIVGAALAIQIWRTKTHGMALIHVENGDILFLESMETPNKLVRIRVSDVTGIAIAGLPDDQRYRFTLQDGQVIVLRPYFERKYNEQVVRFLEAKFRNNLRIDVQGPLGPMEEMRGEFKAP